MWSSKMASRWRAKDGDLNAANSDFLACNASSELLLSRHGVGVGAMDSQSCMEHSILAIFEDSAVSSEDKSGAEDESETLLSALTEMLDSVEDDDETLSPFDTLPDTKLLTHPERHSNSVELSFVDRLRPRSKSPNATFTIKVDEETEGDSKMESNSPPQLLKQESLPRNKKAEAEVEVFTSISLVNLVKLMHPYCLKLHAEEEGEKLRKNHTLFSQEEVWKYERPSGESDEEINVVSDDEVTVGDTKGKEAGHEKGVNNRPLKSVLLNGNSPRALPSREKKRVTFGLVQVAQFESEEEGPLTGEAASLPLNSTKAFVNPADSALEVQTLSSEMSSSQAEVLPLKGETKAKSLSLQQYRQLRRKRQPLAEKQRNYVTMWPRVSEPPKELTPILCLQGQRCGAKAASAYPDDRRCIPARPRPQPSGVKRPRTGSKTIPPASLQPDVKALPHVPESRSSPVKKPTLLSSDPPNPVLLPLPLSQTPPPTADKASSKVEFPNRDSNPDSTRHFPGIPDKISGTSLHGQPPCSGLTPEGLLGNQGYASLFQEIKNKLTEVASGVSSAHPALCSSTTQINSASDCKNLQPHRRKPTQEEAKQEPKSSVSLNPDREKQTKCPFLPASASPVEETSSEVHLSVSPPEEPTPLQPGCRGQSAAADSGIEATDLTSLLEQFEETQAQEERVCESESGAKLATSNLQTQPGGTQSISGVALEAFSTSEPPGNPKPVHSPPHLKMPVGADFLEPYATEVILSTQDLTARRKNPPSKAIQIIEPRPLPSKKSHAGLPELSAAHTTTYAYSSVFSDHDYCGSIDLIGSSQQSKASKLKDSELQATTNDLFAAAECKKQTSTSMLNTIRAVEDSVKSVTQHLSETRAEILSTDKVLSTEQDDEPAPCTLPTPPPSPPARGRDKRRYRRRTPRSDSSSSSPSSSSSSESPSPKRLKRRHKRSESSSCSSSSPSRSPPGRCRWSYSRSRGSRSRSRSWSRSQSPSRSRSPSPRVCRSQWRNVYSSRESRKLRREHEIRIQKLKAIEERRVVYVGRIRRSMTHDELRERFSQFGDVECVSLHFRDRGDHYAFVTFYNMDDAFAAIDNGGKLRKPDELPFDICFGGRRQFCNSHYADLDANRDAEPAPANNRIEDLDFDSLLKQAQRGLKS